MKKYALAGLVLVAGLAAAAYWRCNRATTLVDLQKEILFAKSATDSTQVYARLQKYYLTLEIPDSLGLVESVANEVATLLDTTKLKHEALLEMMSSISNEENVYKAEGRLQNGLEKAFIARAQGQEQLCNELFNHMKMNSPRIDAGLGVTYWEPFLTQAARFTPEQARFWLKAKRAAAKCFELHNRSKRWEKGEKYGALSLQYLERAPDERLRLDLVQRLQVILYDYRGLTDLSFLLAQRAELRAHAIGYQLRAMGILFNYANAKHSAGQDHEAFKLFQELIAATAKYHQVPNMDWYRTNGLLRLAYVYWQLGRYEDALRACAEVEQRQPGSNETINLNIVRGNVQLRLGNYDLTESEYRAAILLAHKEGEYDNEAMAYNNLGSMFYNLKEYEKALANYRRAQEVIERGNAEDFATRTIILGNMAEVWVAREETEKFQQLLEEANHFIQAVPLAHRKAQLLRNLGKLNLLNQKHEAAFDYFARAAAMYEKSGLLRLGLENEFYLAQCDLKLKKYSEAKTRLARALEEARQINEPERIIDAYGMLAQIAQEQSELESAIATSNQLIAEIESFSARLHNTERLVLYRNKIDEYLKSAVCYEIQRGRIDLAWEKLDYEKGRALKTTSNGYRDGGPVRFVNLDEVQNALDAKSLVVDYLMTADSLYAFVLAAKSRKLLRKPINRNELQKRAEDYNHAIRSTNTVFTPYNASAIQDHFKLTTILGRQLYEALMVWPDFELCANEERKLYLIPDAFLYEVPFSTLVVDTSSKAVTFVIQAAAVLQIPSLSFLLSRVGAQNKLPSQTAKVLLSADPAFSKSSTLIQSVQEKYPGATLLETAQSPLDKDVVLTALAAKSDYELQLYVGHSVSNSEDPDLSFIKMAIRNQVSGKIDTLAITLADLKKLPSLAAQFVFLIGCETAQGKLLQGTGLVGLQYGFLSLGAKRVQASLWRIPAEEAITQTQDLLMHWAQNAPSVWTLREIQLQYISKYSNGSIYLQPHPYLWGSYVLVTTMNEN